MVLVSRPAVSDDLPPVRFRGRLLGAMHCRGQLHHYRVEDGDGQLYLCPPHWIVDPVPVLVPPSNEMLAEAKIGSELKAAQERGEVARPGDNPNVRASHNLIAPMLALNTPRQRAAEYQDEGAA
jgi:hypothetical protein